MEINPYAPPQAEVADQYAPAPEYYVVSPNKLLILFIGTMGYYSLYWFYKNWKIHKERTGAEIWPIPRAIFSIFFIHAFCQLIDQKLRLAGNREGFEYGPPATLYVVVAILAAASGYFPIKVGAVPISFLAIFISLPIYSWVLWTIQKEVNIACGQPDGESNHRLTGANYFWLILGALSWLSLAFLIWAVVNFTPAS